MRLEQIADPLLFRLLDIPKPLRAELLTAGDGGSRTAYFANGKKFEQHIMRWEPPTHYTFSFNPEPGFRVGYLFELWQAYSGCWPEPTNCAKRRAGQC